MQDVYANGCTINGTVEAEQFTAADNDTCIMEAARQTLAKDQIDEQLKNEWENHTEARRRMQDKNRLMEQMSVRYAHLLADKNHPKKIIET